MVSSVKYIAETQEDEKCDVFLVLVEEDVIGYLQECSTFRLGDCVQGDYSSHMPL